MNFLFSLLHNKKRQTTDQANPFSAKITPKICYFIMISFLDKSIKNLFFNQYTRGIFLPSKDQKQLA
tara:strand:- start:435 stop:635 length:201 start_codon:yes stop_codon:yes gene_type:complete